MRGPSLHQKLLGCSNQGVLDAQNIKKHGDEKRVQNFVGEPEVKKLSGTPRRRYENKI
jgi:hypothetical protein